MKHWFAILSSLMLWVGLSGCSEHYQLRSAVAALSVSSDGRYVISTHYGNHAVLWDLKTKTKRYISHDANIYSAYFIRHSHHFMWQAHKNNMVYIQEAASNHLVKTFDPGFASTGQQMTTDLRQYIGATEDWNLFQYDTQSERTTQLKKGFGNYGKPLSLTLVEPLLVSAGSCDYKGESLPVSAGLAASDLPGWRPGDRDFSLMTCITLYDVRAARAIAKFTGNASLTHATLSPDGRHLVSGDVNSQGFVWNTTTGKQLLELDSLFSGHLACTYTPKRKCHWDASRLIPPPDDFCDKALSSYKCWRTGHMFAMKFIGPTEYLRFTNYVPYAILYDVLDSSPKKYFKLKGRPAVYGYEEAGRVDTAPDVGILVMASQDTSGIVVYQYDKKKQSLNKIWTTEGPPPYTILKMPYKKKKWVVDPP